MMNKIIINEEELRKITSYKPEKIFEGFIFDDFKLIIKHDSYREIYKIKIEDEEIKINHRIVNKGIIFKEIEFAFLEDEKSIVCINSNGDAVSAMTYNEDGTIVEQIKEDDNKDDNKYMVLLASVIRNVKQYIMNESYKRRVIHKVSGARNINRTHGSNKVRRETNNTMAYLLNDIIDYVSSNKSGNIITCECWTVRGHFRHYKNGLIVWVKSYEKGSKRNTGVEVNGKVYSI